MNNRAAVDRLLVMYDDYKRLGLAEAELSMQLAKQKLRRHSDQALLNTYQQVRDDRQTVSDKMTFANPIIWMTYKFEAYANEAQPIRTMHDFRIHCSKAGYICTKRFNFLNTQLENRGFASLGSAESYADHVSLDQVVESEALIIVTQDVDFMRLWNHYEFHTVNGQPAKWENK